MSEPFRNEKVIKEAIAHIDRCFCGTTSEGEDMGVDMILRLERLCEMDWPEILIEYADDDVSNLLLDYTAGVVVVINGGER